MILHSCCGRADVPASWPEDSSPHCSGHCGCSVWAKRQAVYSTSEASSAAQTEPNTRGCPTAATRWARRKHQPLNLHCKGSSAGTPQCVAQCWPRLTKRQAVLRPGQLGCPSTQQAQRKVLRTKSSEVTQSHDHWLPPTPLLLLRPISLAERCEQRYKSRSARKKRVTNLKEQEYKR